jgi:hypothetical protein
MIRYSDGYEIPSRTMTIERFDAASEKWEVVDYTLMCTFIR